MRWLHLLFTLLVNAIPLVGVHYLDWSIGVVLLLYWIENLLVAVTTTARIALHRALTRKSGHWRLGQLGGIEVNGEQKNYGLLGEYAVPAFAFTLVHGVFVLAIVFLFGASRGDDPAWHFSFAQLRVGALQMAGVMAVDLLLDAATLRSRSFAWIKKYAQQRMGRVLVLHLGIIFGMWAMTVMDSPLGALYVLIVLKTLWDLAASSSAQSDALPAQPPRWTQLLADRFDQERGGAKRLIEDWQRSIAEQKRAALDDEKVRTA